MLKLPEVEFVTFKTEEFGDVTPCELVNSFPSLLSSQLSVTFENASSLTTPLWQPEKYLLVCFPTDLCKVPGFFTAVMVMLADPSGRPVWGVGLRPLAWWVCGFESRRRYRCPYLVNVVCCHVWVSATDWSLSQGSYRFWCVRSVLVKPRKWGGSGPLGLLRREKKKKAYF
jgi:hypothetical protein